MDNTIVQQGYFTSTGASVKIDLVSGVDWMAVYNLTQAAANQTTALGVKYYWQKGFADDAKWVTFKSNAAAAANLEQYLTSSGFKLIDSSIQTLDTLKTTITAVSNASIPVVTNTGTNGLVAGDVVRLFNVASAQQLGGMDFTVGYNTLSSTTFSLDYMAQIVAGTTGSWRKIKFNPLFYPRRRYITAITKAANAVVTLSVTHQFTVGQSVRMVVPSVYGMVEMNGLQGNILAINTTTTSGNTVTLDIDSSAFTTFAFPLSASVPFSPAEMTPIGQDTAITQVYGGDLDDATNNLGIVGMQLTGGASCPAGAASDVMFWVAGKSFSANDIQAV